MNFQSLPAAGLQTPRWTPYQAPLRASARALGQAVQTSPAPAPSAPIGPVQIVTSPPVPFIDGAFFNLLFDAGIATAGGIAGTVFWKQSNVTTYEGGRAKSDDARKSDRRAAWFFYAIGGLGALKGILDASRLMR